MSSFPVSYYSIHAASTSEGYTKIYKEVWNILKDRQHTFHAVASHMLPVFLFCYYYFGHKYNTQPTKIRNELVRLCAHLQIS